MIRRPRRCTYAEEERPPCGRVAVAVYRCRGQRLDRCRQHDTQRVQRFAEERGWERAALVTA